MFGFPPDHLLLGGAAAEVYGFFVQKDGRRGR